MRLTLRTLLAYMDDVLDADANSQLGRRIDESEFASGLVHRIRNATRRLRLPAPRLVGRGMGLDPNTVAEYLDSTLAQDRVPEFEKVCLESEVHLAEVASCHQILTLVLGQPREVSPNTRQRICDLIHPAESTASAEVASDEVASDEVASDELTARSVAASESPLAAHEPTAGNGVAEAEKARPKMEVPDYLREESPAKSRVFPYAITLVVAFLLAAVALFAMGPFDENHPVLGVFLGKPAGPAVADGSGETPPPNSPTDPGATSPEPGAPAGRDPAPAQPIPGTNDPAEQPGATSPIPGEPGAAQPAPDNPAVSPPPAATPEEAGPVGPPVEPGGPRPVTPRPLAPAPGAATPDPVAPAVAKPATPDPLTPVPAAGVVEPGIPAPGDAAPGIPAPGVPAPGVPASGAPTAPAPTAPAPTAPAPTVPAPTVPAPTVPAPTVPAAPGGAGGDVPLTPEPAEPPVAAQVGRFLSENQVLARWDENSKSWLRLAPNAVLATNNRFQVLPTFRPQILPGPNVKVTFVGAGVAGLTRPSGQTVSQLELYSGRTLIVSVGGAGARLGLNLGGRSGMVTLADADSQVAIEVYRFLPPGTHPEQDAAVMVSEVMVTSGRVAWQEETQPQRTIEAGQRLVMVDRQPGTVGQVGQFPAWVDPRRAVAPSDREASESLEPMLDERRPLRLQLMELVEHRLVDVRSLAARCLAQLDDPEPLIGQLSDRRQKSFWAASFTTMRQSVTRSPESAKAVRVALEKLFGDDAKALYRMTWGYSPAQLTGGSAEDLVAALEHRQMAVRVLAFRNLVGITDGMTQLFRPEEEPSRQRSRVLKWRKRLDEGAIVYKHPPAAVPDRRAVPGK